MTTTTRPYESPLRAEQLEQTRLRILEAMADVLADEEVEEVTVPLVAMRARVSVRTVYRHFPTKEALFDAFGEWGEKHLRMALMSYPETLDELRNMAPAQYRGYEENVPLMRALLSKRGQEIRARTRRQRLRTFEKAMREVTTTLSPAERRRALAVVYLLVSAPAWQAMRDQWGLEGEESGKAAAWAVRVLTDELRRNPASIKEVDDDDPLAERTFVPPGPGSWFLDPTHWTRPVTRFHAEIFPDAFKRGSGESFRRYGSLLEYLEAGFVNGFPYYCARPVGAPREAVGHPPKEVWDELARTHPEIRRRLSTSATVFERKLWREDLERWDREVKPAAIRAHLALLKIDPDTLDTTGLLEYLDRCRENQVQGAYIHHFFNVPALLPVGDFLVCAQEWTGRSPAQLLGLLQGANPDPLGADKELERLVGALQHEVAARKVLTSAREPGEVVAALRSFSGEMGALASAYVDRVAYRPVNGEDVGEPSVQELPELIVGAIRAALERVDTSLTNDLERRTAEVRDAVPARHRVAFDELLGEARATCRLRDERGTYADLWAIGIMRRAILSAGRRLAARGLLIDPAHLVEASYAELRSLVDSRDGPSGDELAERARYRLEARYADAPPFLGGEPGDPLPAEWLPPAAARLERAMGAVLQAMFTAPQPRTEERMVRGLGVSRGVYEGTARVIRGTEEFGRIEQGDVLVTNSTTTAFNIVLPLLGAIVTDRGGLLSHAAIVAREYGLPAVVGCTDATSVLPDGARVIVDGTAGEAEVVA